MIWYSTAVQNLNWFAQVVHKLSKKHSKITKHLNGFVPRCMNHKRIPTDLATAEIVKQYICHQCKTRNASTKFHVMTRGLYTPRYFPYGFHMEWVDSNLIPWTGHGPFFGWQPSHFIFPYPLWNPYGMPMEWCLPYAVHGLVHMDSMEFPVNLYYKSMYYSIWIPWNESIKFRGKFH